MLSDCVLCTARVLVEFSGSVGWNRPYCVQDGTYTGARYVAVTKGIPWSAADACRMNGFM